MSQPYAHFCDDFYVNMRMGSQMALTQSRDTILHFFEMLTRAYPGMSKFRKGEGVDYSLEEDRSSGVYRWVSLETNRLSAGHVNPIDVPSALKLHHQLLDAAPHQLGVSSLELDYLDVLFGFDLEFTGNQDEIIAESLYDNSPMASLLDIEGVKPVDFQPTVIVALTDDVRLQARIDVITRTSGQQIRSGNFSEDVISVYLTLRRFWDDLPKKPIANVFDDLALRAEKLAESHVLPRIVSPIRAAIASRS